MCFCDAVKFDGLFDEFVFFYLHIYIEYISMYSLFELYIEILFVIIAISCCY